MKYTTQDRLRQLMSERNLKQVDILKLSKKFQDELGIKMSKSHLSQYVNGKSSPDQHKLYLLAKTLNVSEAWLMGYDAQKERAAVNTANSENSHIELIYTKLNDRNKKRVYFFAEELLQHQNKKHNIVDLETYRKLRREKPQDYTEFPHQGYVGAAMNGEDLSSANSDTVPLPSHIIPIDADYCLTANGDSMEPVIHDGDYIFVKENPEIFSGMLGVGILNGNGYVKRIWFENDGARLESFNKKYDDIMVNVDDDFRIIGRVVN